MGHAQLHVTLGCSLTDLKSDEGLWSTLPNPTGNRGAAKYTSTHPIQA